MPVSRAPIAAALWGIVLSCQAYGQTPSDTKFLDDLAAQRNAEVRPKPDRPAPVPTPHEQLLPTNRVWVCMSTTPWQPVLASPYPSAPVIGQTQPQIAASNGWVNGYAQVLFYNGKLGFIPSASIRPYHSDVNPHGTCTVAGLRPDGAPAFAYR